MIVAAVVESGGHVADGCQAFYGAAGDRPSSYRSVAIFSIGFPLETSGNKMITSTKTSDSRLRRQWRRQLAAHGSWEYVAAQQGFVAIAYLDNSSRSTQFVDINNLFVLLLFEDEPCRYGHIPLRLSGYKVSRIPHGVQWGGAQNCKLFKDVTLAPQCGAGGQRLDRSKLDLLEHVLRLDRRLSRAARHWAAPWPDLQLPKLWAGFCSRHAAALRGNGPEFEQVCADQLANEHDFFRAAVRRIDGLMCYPLDWVSGQLEGAAAVFAEIAHRFRRQVCQVDTLADGLSGFLGASAFDFYGSRFREQVDHRHNRCDSTRQKCLKLQRHIVNPMSKQVVSLGA